MAQRSDDPSKQVQSVNGKKIYVAQQASTVTSAAKQLSNVAFRGSFVAGFGTGNLLVLQGSQDFRYNFSTGAGTATTDDILVKANIQEYVYCEAADTYVNVIRDSADGVVRVYCVV